MNPYQVTRDFEAALCEYTGAPFAVAVNSCTAALLLAVKHRLGFHWRFKDWPEYPGDCLGVEIPRHTYCSVPMAIWLAGGWPVFRDENWRGAYELRWGEADIDEIAPPLNVWDCARRFTFGMYLAGQFQCVSFAASKILAAEQGGAILHDSPEANAWFRRMRFDGRTEGIDPQQDQIKEIGHHCIMTPSVAAGLLVRLHHLPKHNADMGDYPYPDLSKLPAFR